MTATESGRCLNGGSMTTTTRGLLAGVAALTMMVAANSALAQSRTFNLPAQSAVDAIPAFARQAGVQIIVPSAGLRGVRTPALVGTHDTRQGLQRLIAGTGLEVASDSGSTIVLRPARAGAPARTSARSVAAQETPVRPRARRAAPPPSSEAEPRAEALEDIVVTARRMDERIIDVPVAVSAFTAQQLDDRKIEGGAELLRAVPNVNFSKDNFTSYNFSIRGIGAKVQATTADPGVAISFNNTPLLRNRLFEQEYFDVQRLEVLRGPQGTLYGRNATAGVVNLLPNLPELGEFSAEAQRELGNFESERARGYLNIPFGDTLAIRIAGALTKRDGFDYNTVTQQSVNGRDLWSTRVGVLWQPTANFRANLLWERFREDDDRSRTGKMLCTRGEAPAAIEWTDPDGVARSHSTQAYWTRTSVTPGCTPSSLYSDDAYSVPDGRSFPITAALTNMTSVFVNPRWTAGGRPPAGYNNAEPNGFDGTYLFPLYVDPFAVEGNRQVADLRTVSTAYDPQFKAENDLFQLNLDWDLSPGLTLHSQTLYMKDVYSGRQDFFRSYATSQMYAHETVGKITRLPRTVAPGWAPWIGASTPNGTPVYNAPTGLGDQFVCGTLPDCGIPTGGTFLDPQLGLTDRFMAIDRSDAESTQWAQEFRLQSALDGPFNFNLGANWLRYETEENYYIFSNVFTMMAVQQNLSHFENGNFDQYCNPTAQGQARIDAGTLDRNVCAYIDPNPLDQINGQGHNYIRNVSISKTESWAVFGEGYWSLHDDLRLTLGLRYTDDTKTMTPVPGQLLTDTDTNSTGLVGIGYPRYPDEELNWGEWTGRAVIDWKPALSFTEDTLVYASYSRGYKGGGGNPRDRDYNPNLIEIPSLPSRYDPEFVNAYEIGMKNLMAGGRLSLNATGFFYDYKNYQIAQIMDRAMHNENFDAEIYGAEFEAAWTPVRNFRLDATLGLLKTRIGDGEESIDVMNRTQGNKDWIVMRPWPGSPSTCIVPADIVGRIAAVADAPVGGRANNIGNVAFMRSLCPSVYHNNTWTPGAGNQFNYADNWRDQWQAANPINWNPFSAPNGGRGFAADLSGNALPNAPRMTFNLGAQYRIELPQGWDVTVRGDYYRQSESWMRVYNTEYDRLRSWDNANLSLTLGDPSGMLTVQAYVKNVFDRTPITDGFTGPDELGNFTNVFTLDPRISGFSIRKRF